MASLNEPLTDAGVRALALRYRLMLDVKSSAGIVGARQGRETGASVEIQDFRDYMPGDDLRRVDWLAYGRTDRLVVRLFREEVNPFLDIIVDTSMSLAIPDGRKHALANEICRWFYHSARAEGIAVRLFSAGVSIRRLEDLDQLVFQEPESILFTAPARAASLVRRSSVRLILTDFMYPADPAVVLRPFSAGCSLLVLAHILGPWEADPRPEGPSLLEGVEENSQIDIQLDRKSVEAYRRRLNALVGVVRDEVFRCGGLYVRLIADKSLEETLKEDFLQAGLVKVQ